VGKTNGGSMELGRNFGSKAAGNFWNAHASAVSRGGLLGVANRAGVGYLQDRPRQRAGVRAPNKSRRRRRVSLGYVGSVTWRELFLRRAAQLRQIWR